MRGPVDFTKLGDVVHRNSESNKTSIVGILDFVDCLVWQELHPLDPLGVEVHKLADIAAVVADVLLAAKLKLLAQVDKD